MENTNYNPAKNYRWEKETEFKFLGTEFAFLFNKLGEFISTPLSPASFMKLNEILLLLQSKIAQGVDEGGVVEDLKEEPIKSSRKSKKLV